MAHPEPDSPLNCDSGKIYVLVNSANTHIYAYEQTTFASWKNWIIFAFGPKYVFATALIHMVVKESFKDATF